MITFLDGMDHYSTSELGMKWSLYNRNDSVSYPNIASSGRHDSKNLFGGANGGYTTYTLPASTNSIIFGFAFKVLNISDVANTYFLNIYNSTPDSILLMEVKQSGKIEVRPSYTSSLKIKSKPNVIRDNTWHYLEVKCKFSGANSYFYINMDSVPVLSYTGPMATGTTNNSIVMLQLTGRINFIDDFYFVDNTGDTYDFLGDVKVTSHYVSAPGRLQQWAASGVATATLAVSGYDIDSSYVSTSTSGRIHLCKINNDLRTNVKSIKAVQYIAATKKQGAGKALMIPLLGNGSTEQEYTTVYLWDKDYDYHRVIAESNPFTSLPWQRTDFTTLEIGAKTPNDYNIPVFGPDIPTPSP